MSHILVMLCFMFSQGDFEFLSSDGSANKYGYIVFFTVMMIWEVIPTFIIVFFFRVRFPHHQSRVSRVVLIFRELNFLQTLLVSKNCPLYLYSKNFCDHTQFFCC